MSEARHIQCVATLFSHHEELDIDEHVVSSRTNAISFTFFVCRASVLPFEKGVNSVSGFANSVFYRFRFAKFRFFTVSDI